MLVDPIFDGNWIPRVNRLILVAQLTKSKIKLGREHVLVKVVRTLQKSKKRTR